MKLFGWRRGKLHFFGIQVLRRKKISSGVLYLLAGALPIFFIYDPLLRVAKDFSLESPLDAKGIDARIKKIADKLPTGASPKPGKNIVILATEMYDAGGHTECIKNIVSAMPDDRTACLFLTRIDSSREGAKNKMREIANYCGISGLQYDGGGWREKLRRMFNEISAAAPRAVLSFIHMDDAFGAALLAMLKRAGIKILYFNHGSHYPALGMTFADVILEGTKTTERITREKRGFDNTAVVGLPYMKESDLPKFNAAEIANLREKLLAGGCDVLTMSGASAYKFFDEKRSESPYFEMIKRLLERNKNMTHIVLTDPISPSRKAIFDRIFAESGAADRIKIMPFAKNYKLWFKCADIFIDSFPVSSALTQIDLISLWVPNVIKINTENPMLTFHEYMPENYPYAYETVADMERGIQDLMDNPGKRKSIAESNYRFFLETYPGDVFCIKLLELCDD